MVVVESETCLQERIGGSEPLGRGGTCLVFTRNGKFGRRINKAYRRKKEKANHWKMLRRGGEPRWARERWCKWEPGRASASELGLERSSVVVSLGKVEGPLAVWVRVGKVRCKLGRKG